MINKEDKTCCLIGLYKYVVVPRITTKGQFIQMGCYLRSRDEWELDFWNNPNEFPNNGNIKSVRREQAFKIACAWLDFNN